MASTTLNNVSVALKAAPWSTIAVGSIGFYVAYNVAKFAYDYWVRTRSPLRLLPGPKERAGWIFGHIPFMFNSENNGVQERWVEELGETFAIRTLFGKYQLVTLDNRANTHILFASHIYQKSSMARRASTRFLGESVLTTEGDQHRDQRRLLNPAFGFSQVRNLTGIFLDKSAQLCDIWYNKCIANGGSAQLNALGWLSKATLDAIGKAGFDYDFETLNETGRTNELAEAFENIFRIDVPLSQQMRLLMADRIPILRAIMPSRRARLMDKSKVKMDRIGMRIVQEKKQAVLANAGGKIEKNDVDDKDVISLLLQANLASDIDPSHRISDHEVLAQIPTFLVAGHETTSNSTTWAMFALARNPDIQRKLREELVQLPDNPTLDTLNAAPYLDKFTREVLRFHTVVSFIQREAFEDDVIPLSKPIVDRNGKTITEIRQANRIQKGDSVLVPIWLVNRSKSIWGPDANEFRPERWDNPPQEAGNIPGISPHLMSFIGGPRACIGFRFAIAEMKALLFHIIRRFEWKLAVEPTEIWSRTGVLVKTQLRGSNSVELPVVLTPIA